MCKGCWEEYGSPKIDTNVTRAAAKAVENVYRYNCVGGHLHIVLDDWNIKDGSLEFCAGAIRDNIASASTEQRNAESYCLGMLEKMSLDERASALALHDRFF